MNRALLIAILAFAIMAPSAAVAKRINRSLIFGQDALLAKNGPVSLRARCVLNDGGFDRVEVYATTTSNAVMRGAVGGVFHGVYNGNGTYLTAVSPPESAVVAGILANTGEERVNNAIDGGFVVNIAEMRGFTIRAESSLLGINTGGKHCILSLDFDALKKFKLPK